MKILLYLLGIILGIILLVFIYWCLESWIFRPMRKYKFYRMAKKKANQKNKRLIVVGDPYSGAGPTQMIQNLSRKNNFELYGCGDYCIDITGCPKCKYKTDESLEKALKKIPSNSSVVFISGTLEYVNADMKSMLDDLVRIAGKDIYVVTVKDLTGHYGYECVGNNCTSTFNNLLTQKSTRFVSKAPPEYSYFEWTDKKDGIKRRYQL